ncbi:hypothetical protein [Actinoallomurus iriomotensis]|nr:hypothetical protein [Actinoallomurus iriomotensis]
MSSGVITVRGPGTLAGGGSIAGAAGFLRDLSSARTWMREAR